MIDYKQTTPYYCGPACLRIVGWLVGLRYEPLLSQSSLAQAAGTTLDGTGIAGMKKVLLSMGVTTAPRRGKLNLETAPSSAVIVWDRTRDHWLVATREGEWWTVMDPELGTESLQTQEQFQRAHFSRWNSYGMFLLF